MDELKSSLSKIAGKVDQIIAESTFPTGVRPAYLAAAMRSYPANGGKRLRPAIMLWSVAAAGGNMEDFLPAAAGLEIFHNWTLVHDDIIDDDDSRRGEPTAHVTLARAMELPENKRRKFGCDMAILAGDLMQGWAFDLVDQSRCSAELKLKLAAELRSYGYIKLVSGEALDVEMSFRSTDEAELLAMQSGKTGALLHYAARAGWMAGRGQAAAWNDEAAQALGSFGEYLAWAFQMRDDYLGIFGKYEEFGKPIGSDLAEGKATLLLLHALQNLPEAARKKLQSLLYCSSYTPDMLETARELFQQAGSLQYVLDMIDTMTCKAQQALDKLPETAEREILRKLAGYLAYREK